MEKLEKSQDYVKDERKSLLFFSFLHFFQTSSNNYSHPKLKTIVSRLERLIESKSVSGDKLDEFSIRKNILKSFQ